MSPSVSSQKEKGKELRVEAFEGSEEALQKYENAEEQLVEAAQSAFPKEGMPTYKDVLDHIDAETLVLGEVDGDIVGFSATSTLEAGDEDLVYAEGNVVHEDYQSSGVGSVLRLRGVKEQLDEESVVATRSASGIVLDYMQDLFNSYPKKGEDTPERIDSQLRSMGKLLEEDAEINQDLVMKSAYPGSMYGEDHPDRNSEFLESIGMDHYNGDALLIGGEVPSSELEKRYSEIKEAADYKVIEKSAETDFGPEKGF